MRHLMGVVLAMVMAGVLFFAGAWGYLRLMARTAPLSRLPAGGGSLLSDHGMLAALIAVAGTGLLAGILVAAPRVSPLAAGLPGLVLLGWTALYLVSVRHAVHLIPLKSHPYGAGFEAMLVHGILGAAGLAMIIPLPGKAYDGELHGNRGRRMNASLLAVLNDAERQLVDETEQARLAELDEDGAIELETRIRRARNKYVGQYRRGPLATLPPGRGLANRQLTSA